MLNLFLKIFCSEKDHVLKQSSNKVILGLKLYLKLLVSNSKKLKCCLLQFYIFGKKVLKRILEDKWNDKWFFDVKQDQQLWSQRLSKITQNINSLNPNDFSGKVKKSSEKFLISKAAVVSRIISFVSAQVVLV